MKLSNWGNYPEVDVDFRSFVNEGKLSKIISEAKEVIPRGLGRCYGDSSLSQTVVSSLRFNRMISFDEESGELVCESGVSLEDILDVFVSRGWFLPTTPGTKFVTVGGAIASNVHGKNHHLSGSFCHHVNWMEIMLASGEVVRCSKDENSELFEATAGGMGLTGYILRVSMNLIRVETAFIRQEMIKAKNLSEIMDVFEDSDDWTYSVAWIDCLMQGENMGRSLMMRGEHAGENELVKIKHRRAPLILPKKLKLNVPINFPSFALNPLTVKAFNALYYMKGPKESKVSIVDYDQFFYPLDGVLNWNRIYGKRGFTQYQFVLPKDAGREGLGKVLSRIAESGQGSFLAVLKLFGQQDDLFSFPKEGYTLALDFPIKNGLFKLLDELDDLVLDYGGRLYFAKDVRMEPKMLAGYPYAERFKELKHKYDPDNRFASLQSKRVGI
ncbi:MAG: FAD-binding oxidoreductase [Gammaproteobacteria bacterium]|nr:MAG: FAD-binding oxidoreductase [Gammaproteobacteria bacterium]